MSEELGGDVDLLFLAVLAGLIANGSSDDWHAIYQHAKVGAQTILTCIIDDALEDELTALQKDSHGRLE